VDGRGNCGERAPRNAYGTGNGALPSERKVGVGCKEGMFRFREVPGVPELKK
jgi:hypothetical protein